MGNYSRSGGPERPPKKEKKSGGEKKMTYSEGRDELKKLLEQYEKEK